MKVLLTFCLMFLAACLPLTGLAQTTAFTYQGELSDSGAQQATYQMRFRLFGALVGGSPIGSTIENAAVAVDDGIFSVALDFGANPFPGADRFLEISVRRNVGESYTVLSPRQQIASSPYAIRTLSAQTADLAMDSEKLGGLDASEYVTSATVGSAFVRNDTTQQTANFNISGTGVVGSALGIGVASPSPGNVLDANGAARFTPGGSGGAIALGTPNAELGMSIVGANRADIRFDGSMLRLLAGIGTGTPSSLNGLGISTSGLIGAATPPNGNFRIDSFGPIRAFSTTAAHFVAETTGGTNTWARFYMRSPSQSWFLGTSQAFSGNQLYIADETAGQTRMVIATNGNVGIGAVNPATRMTLSGGVPWTAAGWTASMNMQNVSALGWEANASGQRFGIGQTNGGLYFFRTNSAFGNSASPANYDMAITDNGHLTQRLGAFGLPKAMIFVNGDGTILRCYNGTNGSSSGGCGFSVFRPSSGRYDVNFGFNVQNLFYVATPISGCCGSDQAVAHSMDAANSTTLRIHVYVAHTDPANATDRPVMVVVY